MPTKFITSSIFIFLFAYSNALLGCEPQHLLQRSLDGSCNNILDRDLGKASTFFQTGPKGREAYPWAYIPKVDPHPTFITG